MMKATQKLHEMGQSLWLDNPSSQIKGIASFTKAGIDPDALASQLQVEGAPHPS